MAVKLFAAIDVGSHDVEMCIYQIASKSGIKLVDRLKQSIAVGHESYTKGRISYEYIGDLCRIIAGYAQIMKQYNITDYKAYGTSALREAVNREIVLDQIRIRTGIDVTVLNNAEQRFLCYKAIAAKQPDFSEVIKKGTMIVEVGSGRTQLSIFDEGQLQVTQSLKIGALRAKEILLQMRPDETQEHAKLMIEEIVDRDIQSYKRLFMKDRKNTTVTLIMTGICAPFIRKRAMQKMPHSSFMTIEEFNAIYNEVLSYTAFDLSKRMDISIDYAYLMLPSVMIYKKIIALTGAERLMVPGVTLADGMVSEYALQNKLVRFDHDFNADIISAVRSIAGRYRSNQKHARSLETLSLAIFDSMKKLHGLTRRERLLLQLSCVLHDIGKFVSMSDQADCSYYIIMSTEIIGLSTAERRTLANVVKYYHEDFDYEVLQDEGVERRNVVAKLVAILKVAGVLDRSHKQKIGTIRCDIKDDKLVITSDTPNDLTLEQLMLPSRAEFFEEVYGIRPVLRKKRVTAKN